MNCVYVIDMAPLQGFTDAIYREIHAEVWGGVAHYYTPFVRIEKGNFRRKDLRDIEPQAEGLAHTIPQLIAATPDELKLIVERFCLLGYQEVDLNVGCPFPMQVRQHRGAGLLSYPDEFWTLLESIRTFPEIRFSLKLRLGWADAGEALRFLPFLHELPLTHITLHPRLGIQQYKGTVDLDAFTMFYEACRLPLLYNGDLCSVEDIKRITTRFPRLKGVMMGRGLLAAPWLALEYQIGQSLSAKEKRERLHYFHDRLLERYSAQLEGGEHQCLDKMKGLWEYLLPDAEKRLRKKILKSSRLTIYQAAVHELLQNY